MPRSRNIDLSRLTMAMQRSRLVLKRFREERREAVRQYVGRHYSDEGTQEKVPINLIALYASVVGRNLIAKNPRVMLSTFEKSQKPTVAIAEAWANKEIERLHLAGTLQRVVLDALFSLGICKVALATPADAASVGWNLRAGEPFAERVDLDDFVFDIHARDFSEVSFIGHRYRAPLEVIRESKEYGPERKKLEGGYDPAYNLEGDERISMIGRTYYGIDSEEFEDHIDLWEVYLPRHRLILTLADDQLTGASTQNGYRPLREQAWLGPDTGPYHLLSFGVVPGNAMPKAPIMDLIDLHLFANQTYRKLMRQTERQKDCGFVQGGATEDGDRAIKASDGDFTRVDNPENIKLVSMGGPNQQNFGMFQQTYDIFNRQAGNLELLGGTAPQSRTLGQDKMLEQNASGQVSDMQDRTVDYVSHVIGKDGLIWYWWHNPRKTMQVTHSIPGSTMTIRRQATPQQRQMMALDDVDMKIDPYSMQHQTPQSRFAALNTIVTQIVMPMMQIAQQQGVAFDINAYLQKAGQYLDQPDLAEILTIIQPPDQEASTQGGRGGMPMKPANTTRTYQRHSSGSASRYGKDLGMLNAMKQPQQNGQQPQGNGMVR